MASEPAPSKAHIPHVVRLDIRCHSEEQAVRILNAFSGLLDGGYMSEPARYAKVDTAGIFPASVYDATKSGDVTK